MIEGLPINNITPAHLFHRFAMLKTYLQHYNQKKHDLSSSEEIQYDTYDTIMQQMTHLQGLIMESAHKTKQQQMKELLLLGEQYRKAQLMQAQIKKNDDDYEMNLMKAWRKTSQQNKAKNQQGNYLKKDKYNNTKFAYLTSDIMRIQRTALLKINENRQAIRQLINQIQQAISIDHKQIQNNYVQLQVLMQNYRTKTQENIAKYKKYLEMSSENANRCVSEMKDKIMKQLKEEQQLRMNSCKQMKSILRQLKDRIFRKQRQQRTIDNK